MSPEINTSCIESPDIVVPGVKPSTDAASLPTTLFIVKDKGAHKTNCPTEFKCVYNS